MAEGTRVWEKKKLSVTKERYSVARDKVQRWGKDMILTLELNKNNTMILKWPKVTFSKVLMATTW